MRAEISHRLIHELGMPMAEIARYLGVYTSAVSKAIRNFESEIKSKHFQPRPPFRKKILLMFLVHSGKKTVREVFQGRISLPGRDGKWIEGARMG